MHKITYCLEMLSPDQLKPTRMDRPGLRIERVEIAFPEFSKFLHTVVGHEWRWGGRGDWTREDWRKHARRDDLETWVAYLSGVPAGYFELERQADGAVRILCFGLMQQFIGQGLGGHLLTVAVERAWELGARRVWLRTCSHDHPHALKNYLARGFEVFDEVEGPANPATESFWD